MRPSIVLARVVTASVVAACVRVAAILVAISLAALSSGALAQRAPQGASDVAPNSVPESAHDVSFIDDQREGLRLFSQSCGVCHTMVQQRTRQYGPVLSRETLGGDEDLIREYIGNGTPRMPGFRYYFDPAQINAIVAYIKTIPPSGPSPARGGEEGGGGAR
jgi:mono/diheme cytochrome c family protein